MVAFLAALVVAIAAVMDLAGCGTKGQHQATTAAAAVTTTNAATQKEVKAETKTPKASAEAVTNAAELDKLIRKVAAEPAWTPEGNDWQPMFDGKTLKGWAPTDFSGQGQVYCESGLMVLGMGNSLTGVNWTNDEPKVNYEIALEAVKLQGSDFFCGLTFPVTNTFCTLILGGWGGTVVGLSSIESQDASENETTKFMNFETGRWYHVRLRVTEKKIQAWIDDQKMVDLDLAGRSIALRFGEIESSKPLGIASYETTAGLRGIRIRQKVEK